MSKPFSWFFVPNKLVPAVDGIQDLPNPFRVPTRAFKLIVLQMKSDQASINNFWAASKYLQTHFMSIG